MSLLLIYHVKALDKNSINVMVVKNNIFSRSGMLYVHWIFFMRRSVQWRHDSLYVLQENFTSNLSNLKGMMVGEEALNHV